MVEWTHFTFAITMWLFESRIISKLLKWNTILGICHSKFTRFLGEDIFGTCKISDFKSQVTSTVLINGVLKPVCINWELKELSSNKSIYWTIKKIFLIFVILFSSMDAFTQNFQTICTTRLPTVCWKTTFSNSRIFSNIKPINSPTESACICLQR